MLIDALYMTKERTTEIRQIPLSPPGPGQVQVEVVACGVCAWDSYLFLGRDLTESFPFGFGHEAVGVICALGDGVTRFRVGDKVFCINGGPAMAQFINIDQTLVGLLPGNPESVDDFSRNIGEPIVCVVNGLAHTPVVPGASVAVIGCGYMGLLNVQAFCHSHIGSMVCFDMDEEKLVLAKKYGADACWRSNTPEGQEAIKEIVSAGGVDLVIECSGSQAGFAMATELCAMGGVISNFAWHRADRIVNASPWHLKGLQLINTAPGCDAHFSDHVLQAQRLMARGVFDQTDLITHRMDYHQIQDMLLTAERREGGYIKGVITFK